MARALLCKPSKKCKHGGPVAKPVSSNRKLVSILEASESTRLRMGESLLNVHEDHIAGKGTIQCNDIIWCTIYS